MVAPVRRLWQHVSASKSAAWPRHIVTLRDNPIHDDRSLFRRRAVTSCTAILILALSLTVVSAAGKSNKSRTQAGVNVTTKNAIVVTADSIASAVGNQVLLDGGNAVDAAVAVGFALVVTLPRAGNIGGGGFMLIRLHNGEDDFIDYREKAPRKAHRDMYLDDEGKVISKLSTVGHLAVGVPGTVYGLALAHQTHGTLPWKTLLAPAIRLAREGFVINAASVKSLKDERETLRKFEVTKRIFVTPDYEPGDRLIQKDLATTLERIAKDWRDFYTGKTARLIVAEMERHGGLIMKEDLEEYAAKVREPVRVEYHGYQIISAPLPSSGGVILSQLLQMLECLEASSVPRQSSDYVHRVCEAEKIVYRGRALYLGDDDFYPSPWEDMTTPATASRLAKLIHPDRKLKLEDLESEILLPGWSAPLRRSRSLDPDCGQGRSGDNRGFQSHEQTTHFSIVDRWGNAVANTYTLNDSYGSGVVVEGGGFFLNNEMDDFSIKPGHPNLYGLVGSEANAIEPGKRMLSSMSPTIVTTGGELRMVLGTPGGATIPTTLLQVILNVIDRDMPLFDAVAAGRFHEQYLPDRIYVENGALVPDAIDCLLEMAHRIEIRKPIGNVQAILVKEGTLNGVSDPRGNGRAVGH